MRPTISTYAFVIVLPEAGPGTSAAVVGIGTCCARAVVNVSAPTSATTRMVFVFMAVFFVSLLPFTSLSPCHWVSKSCRKMPASDLEAEDEEEACVGERGHVVLACTGALGAEVDVDRAV